VERDVLDAKEQKIYWETCAVDYVADDDEALDQVLFRCDRMLKDAGLSPLYNGWKATAALCEEHYKGSRKKLNAAMGRFRKSGNGDGGPVEIETSITTYSAKFLDFCDGDVALEYMYIVFSRLGLLEFACSDMPEGSMHDSSRGSNAAGPPPKGGPSNKGDKVDPNIEIIREILGVDSNNKDVGRKRKADASVAESKAQGAKLDLMVKQEALLDSTNDDIDKLTGKDDETSNAKRTRLVARKTWLEKSLAECG
jgi:hypothetical protein